MPVRNYSRSWVSSSFPYRGIRRRIPAAILPVRRRKNTLVRKETVKRMIHSARETKYRDTAFNTTINITTQAPVDLTFIAQGDTDSNRIGDSIEWKNLEVRFALGSAGSVAAATAYTTRVVIFQWHPSDAITPPGYGDVMQSTTSAVSPPNHDQMSNYKIIYDEIFNPSNVGEGTYTRDFVIPASRGRKSINFLGGSTSGMNKLYMIAWTNVASGSTSPTFNYYTRLNYYDA